MKLLFNTVFVSMLGSPVQWNGFPIICGTVRASPITFYTVSLIPVEYNPGEVLPHGYPGTLLNFVPIPQG